MTFKDIFPGLSNTKVIFQDFPGPGIFKKIQDFPGVGTDIHRTSDMHFTLYFPTGISFLWLTRSHESVQCSWWNSTLANYNYSMYIMINILWLELSKCSKKLSCTWNLVVDCACCSSLYYASSYKKLVKKCETHICCINDPEHARTIFE